jgi:hypothetical protein
MSAKGLYASWRFWAWIGTAFVLGVITGFALCIVVGIILTATISYAQ